MIKFPNPGKRTANDWVTYYFCEMAYYDYKLDDDRQEWIEGFWRTVALFCSQAKYNEIKETIKRCKKSRD